MRGWPVNRTALLACAAIFSAQILVCQSATFEGTVLNSATHAGLGDVNVTLWTQRGVSYKATTDGSGVFRFAGVPPGEYSLRFQRSGFEQLDQPGFGRPLLRVGAAGALHSDAELVPLAILHGRVLDPEGRPAAHVAVTLGHHEPAESDAEGVFEKFCRLVWIRNCQSNMTKPCSHGIASSTLPSASAGLGGASSAP